MEPIIYKPSIYKGAGIYKTGAEGAGLGPYGVDWSSGGWSAKNVFRHLNRSVTNGGMHDWYDVPGFGFTAPYYSDRKTTPAVYPYVYTNFRREDEHEIKISFIYNVDVPPNGIFCGCLFESDYNTMVSLEFRPNTYNDSFFIIPANSGWGSRFINVLGVNDFVGKRKKITCYLKHYANSDKFYMAFYVDDKLKLENEVVLNDVKYYSEYKSFILGGIKDNFNSAVQRDYWILYESFYKINGDFLAMNLNSQNVIPDDLNVLDWV